MTEECAYSRLLKAGKQTYRIARCIAHFVGREYTKTR